MRDMRRRRRRRLQHARFQHDVLGHGADTMTQHVTSGGGDETLLVKGATETVVP